MKTLAEWLKAHPRVSAQMFERNYNKASGSGRFEEVCGFCLASHYFTDKPRKICKFCRAPIRETRSISDLPEVLNQRWRLVYKLNQLGSPRPILSGIQDANKKGTMSRERRPPKNLASLNPFEEKCWVFAFNYYLDRGKTESEADKLAWLDLQTQFPRLRSYDGSRR
jgi:hypothetical protein